MQGRKLLARLGRRTVLVLDVAYVHQLLEAYVSKLFSLSYGCATIDVHGAEPSDHFLHCFTHRYTEQTSCACHDSWMECCVSCMICGCIRLGIPVHNCNPVAILPSTTHSFAVWHVCDHDVKPATVSPAAAVGTTMHTKDLQLSQLTSIATLQGGARAVAGIGAP